MHIVFDICLYLPKGFSSLFPHSRFLCFFQKKKRVKTLKEKAMFRSQLGDHFSCKIQIRPQCFIEVILLTFFPFPILFPLLAAMLSLLLNNILNIKKVSYPKMFSCWFWWWEIFLFFNKENLCRRWRCKTSQSCPLSLKWGMLTPPITTLGIFLFIPGNFGCL